MVDTSLILTRLSCKCIYIPVKGIDIQRRLASGEGLFSPVNKQDVLNDINLMSRKLKMVALRDHD